MGCNYIIGLHDKLNTNESDTEITAGARQSEATKELWQLKVKWNKPTYGIQKEWKAFRISFRLLNKLNLHGK